MGHEALASSVDGTGNVAIGDGAIWLNQEGAWNTEVGRSALGSAFSFDLRAVFPDDLGVGKHLNT